MNGAPNVIPFSSKAGLKFGIYAGVVSGTNGELATGKPEQPDEINQALDLLQGRNAFLVRTYLRYTGASDAGTNLPSVAELARYTWRGRKLDLVLSNWDRRGNMKGWSEFVETAIERFGPYTSCLQICEAPNLYDYPGDGRFGHAVDSILIGMKTARHKLRQEGLSVAVGFNAVPGTGPGDGFWRDMKRKIDESFVNCVDYIGLNVYPDVAAPIAGEISIEVEETLEHFRHTTLAGVGIPAAVPLHICENGWPTGPNRYYTRQAELLDDTIRTVHRLRGKLNITHYELFALRDADTGNPDARYQFGIMRDDYSPKPAFERYRKLIAELGCPN